MTDPTTTADGRPNPEDALRPGDPEKGAQLRADRKTNGFTMGELAHLARVTVLEVRDAVRNLLSAQEGIAASEREVVAAAEQLRAERIRLEYGESTPFDVLLREEDFVDAEARKIQAFQTYRSSVTGLDRFQGTILRTRNILIDDVRQLR